MFDDREGEDEDDRRFLLCLQRLIQEMQQLLRQEHDLLRLPQIQR